MRWGLLACALAVTGCKPFASDQYSCDPANPSECNERADGVCVADHGGDNRCAYPDTSCPDGLAFGDQSGPNSGACATRPDLFGDGGTGVTGDAFVTPTDAPPEDQQLCVGNDHALQICVLKDLTPRTFADETLYSSTGNNNKNESCDFVLAINNAQTSLCVIQGSTITFNGTVTLGDPTGRRPIAFVATDSIIINGTLDGSTRRDKDTAGPGAKAGDDLDLCKADTAGADGGKTDNDFKGNGGGGGGGGGGFGTAGGNGASGDQNKSAGGHGATGTGADTLVIEPGCRGHGGGGGPVQGGGGGGGPGGAVYLLAVNNIDIATGGVIDVSGEGGGGGGMQAGGGGGGPGGLVGLDAMHITVDGTVVANGGGGGGGGGPNFMDFGVSGISGSTTRAAGGMGTGGGGAGGQGTDANNTTGENGMPGNKNAGGGGGGGGQGVIWFIVSAGTTVSGMSHAIGIAVQKQFP